MSEELLTTSQAARELCVEKVTIRLWIRDGKLEAITLPTPGRPHYRIRRSVLNAYKATFIEK